MHRSEWVFPNDFRAWGGLQIHRIDVRFFEEISSRLRIWETSCLSCIIIAMNMEGKDHARDFKMQEANGLTNGFNSLDVVSPSPSLSQEEYRHSSLSDARKDVGALKVLESKGARTNEEDILMNVKKHIVILLYITLNWRMWSDEDGDVFYRSKLRLKFSIPTSGVLESVLRLLKRMFETSILKLNFLVDVFLSFILCSFSSFHGPSSKLLSLLSHIM